MLGVMKGFIEFKRDPTIGSICAAVRKVLTPEEIAALPAPEIPDESKDSDDPVIAWSALTVVGAAARRYLTLDRCSRAFSCSINACSIISNRFGRRGPWSVS
jgi:hypothetical protein